MTVGEEAQIGPSRADDAIRFFDEAAAAFDEAVRRVGVREHDLVIAGARIRLRFAGPALEPLLLPSIEHSRATDDGDDVALTVSFFDNESTGVRMPAPAWGPYDYGPKGSIVGFNDDRIRTAFSPGVDILNLYDAQRREGIYWVARPEIVPWWETPLRTMVHWWAAPTTLQPLHGGAVGLHGEGVLVVGHSGAGKSTTTLACLEAGMQYVGDDYLVVDTATATAYSLYSTVKLEPENLARFPSLAPLVHNAGRLDEQKAIVRLNEHRGERLVSSLRLRAMVMPHVTGQRDSWLEPGSAAEALRILAPTTSFHLPGYAREVVTKLGALVRSIPCYRLEAGTDLDGVVGTITEFLES
jgi:hypothetical protein